MGGVPYPVARCLRKSNYSTVFLMLSWIFASVCAQLYVIRLLTFISQHVTASVVLHLNNAS